MQEKRSEEGTIREIDSSERENEGEAVREIISAGEAARDSQLSIPTQY